MSLRRSNSFGRSSPESRTSRFAGGPVRAGGPAPRALQFPTGGTGRALTSIAARGAPAGNSFSTSDEDVERQYGGRFAPDYVKKKLLGRGGCGAVWLATSSRHGGVQVAIKQVAKGPDPKSRADERSLGTEITIGELLFALDGQPNPQLLDFPGMTHIVKVLDAVETKQDLWLVMEYGGEVLSKALFDVKGEFASRGVHQPRERVYRVHHRPFYDQLKQDPMALRTLVQQLVSAIDVLVHCGVVHSDLKPDNILLAKSRLADSQFDAKLCDFGSAFFSEKPARLVLATPEYMPPEALENAIAQSQGGPASDCAQQTHPWSFDMWSLGAILLELCYGVPHWLSYKCRVRGLDGVKDHSVTGLFAVAGRDHGRILQRQHEVIVDRGLPSTLRDAPGVTLNEDGLDLLMRMLQWDPLARISPEEALAHPFLAN